MNYTFEVKGIKYTFLPEENNIIVDQGDKVWKLSNGFQGVVAKTSDGKSKGMYFSRAKETTREVYEDGLSYGLKCNFKGFEIEDKIVDFEYTTLIWVHKTTGRVYLELITIKETGEISHANIPQAWEFVRTDEKAYTLFPSGQGEMIPSNWHANVQSRGHMTFNDVRAGMPWFSQVDRGYAYLTIVETQWDANHWYKHTADSDEPTNVVVNWMPSFGKVTYKRITRTEFFKEANYVSICKAYRQYVIEKGNFYTLEQKALANPKIRDLIGAHWIHSYIYYWIKPEAVIYDKEHPENNYKFKTYEETVRQVNELGKKGLRKAYFHLDGWMNEGYDQQHPDVLPPCPKAGGIEGLRALHDACTANNIQLALHDQFRDYYTDAASYDPKNSVMDIHGEIPAHCVWNGGDQNFLCESLAEHYVQRNYDQLEEMGFKPEGVYVDVYACTRLDECANPMHRMSKRECADFRKKCFALLAGRGIIVSSEAGVDQYLPYIVMSHHVYFTGAYAKGDRFHPEFGVGVPLYELVYHDAFIVPWVVKYPYEGGTTVGTTSMLNALMCGGPAYLAIDADKEEIELLDIVADHFEKVGYAEMTNHEFLSDDYKVQRTTFSNGVKVTVDYNKGTYLIEGK